MFTYGSQVNPSLLRQDFSPILQAAQAQAQATQQAAQIRAQSLANIGSTIGGAIQTYVQKKEEKEKRKGSIDFISRVFQSQPNLAKTFQVPLDESGKPDQKALGSILDNFKSPDEAIRSFMALNEFAEQGKARQQQEQAASYAAMLRQGGGQVPSPVSNQALAQFSPQARVAGEAAFLATEQARANLAKTKAEEKALLAPKPVGIESLRFESQQAKDASDKRIADRANQIALKQPGSALNNKAEENAARVAAAKIYESGLVNTTTQVVNPDTGQPEFFQETRNITGELVGRRPVYAPNASPEEQALAAEKVAAATSAVKWMDTFSENASSASTRLAKNKLAIDFLKSGKVETGPGKPFIQGVRRLFASYGGDPKAISDTADFGLVTNILGDQVFEYFSKTKGAISDYETKFIAGLVAKENKTNAENIAILEMAVLIDERTQNAKKALREAQKSGQVKNARDERRFIEDYVDKNPLDFANLSAMTGDPIIDRNLPGRK